MRTAIAYILIAALVVTVGGLALIYSGLYNVAATSPDGVVMRWVLETARTRSIKAHAADIEAPPGLDDPAKILVGVAHFAAHCAVCHGAPGVPQGEMARGLNPLPPDLGKTAPLLSSAEIFWVLKHGIRMTGMPAWSHHSDEELWATVAFLQKLPGMNEEDYGKLVMSTMQSGGGHQRGGGTEDHPADNHDAVGSSHHPPAR
jgi:mono/diheme cytochrome c family protein